MSYFTAVSFFIIFVFFVFVDLLDQNLVKSNLSTKDDALNNLFISFIVSFFFLVKHL